MSEAGKFIRLYQILRHDTNKAVILKLDYGFTSMPSRRDNVNYYMENVVKLGIDSVILTKGLIKRLYRYFKGKNAPTPIMRVDWTNIFRKEHHPLPMTTESHIMYADVDEALSLGASAIYLNFFIGSVEEIEKSNVKFISSIAKACSEEGLPLIVDVVPVGERVVKENYADVVALGARMAVEMGADCICMPWLGDVETTKEVINSLNAYVFLTEIPLRMAKWQPEYSLINILDKVKDYINGVVLDSSHIVKDEFDFIKLVMKKVHEG